MAEAGRIREVLEAHETKLLDSWLEELRTNKSFRMDLTRGEDLRDLCDQFITHLGQGLRDGDPERIDGEAWKPLLELLEATSREWVEHGVGPAEVTAFVLLFKRPLFSLLADALQQSARELVSDIWTASVLCDRLALWTTELFHRRLRDVIQRQQAELLELSTPVVTLWDGILALPLIGTVDSARAQVVMESLLNKIVENGAELAIIDITGVPTVDTMVAQHLLKAVTAARLMGAECIISGIRPSIAQTMVQLGVGLENVTTKGSLADAVRFSLGRRGLKITIAPRD